MAGDYPGPHGRKRAQLLAAADARIVIIQAGLPFVATVMTPTQLGQVQKVLDAAVVNPDVQKEYDTLMRKATVNPEAVRDVEEMQRKYGGDERINRMTGRDPDAVRRADRFLEEEWISVSEADKHVRLNFTALLTPNALTPTTDNPDERAFLLKVWHSLATKGVWLRFDLKLIRSADDPSRLTTDPRKYDAWLCLDYDGVAFTTQYGRLARSSLLDGPFGAGYYDHVIKGKVQTALDNAIKLIAAQIDDGQTLYQQEVNARRQAAPGVAFVSDHLGGARFPSMQIWDLPNGLLARARGENVNGNVKKSSDTVLLAALATQASADLLDDYVDATMKGAGRPVKMLSVAVTAGRVAGYVLLITGLFGALTRALAADAAESAASRAATAGAPPVTRAPIAFQKTNVGGSIANAETLEQGVDKVAATLGTGAGSLATTTAEPFISEVPGFFEELRRLTRLAQAAHPDRWLTEGEMDQIAKAAKAKFGL